MRGGGATKPAGRLRRLRQRLGESASPLRWVAFAVLAVAAIAALVLVGSPFGGDEDEPPPPPPAHIADTRSSWIPGQASLATAPAYRAIAERAEALAGERAEARASLLKRLADKKKADLKRERDKARERYLRLRRLALARYRAALRQNAKDRAAAAKKKAEALARYREAIKKYRESLIVKPGEECKLASVRKRYDCTSGLAPHEPLPGLE